MKPGLKYIVVSAFFFFFFFWRNKNSLLSFRFNFAEEVSERHHRTLELISKYKFIYSLIEMF